jgi:hypothetical protein
MRRVFRYSRTSPWLITKDTRKYGNGVFAAERIPKGHLIFVLGGERMDLAQLVARVNAEREDIDDPLQIGKRTYLDLDELSRTFNHSCSPSAGLRNTSQLFSLRDISQGEEVTYDYSLTIAPTDWWMKCRCGAATCRKVVGDVLSVPRSRLQEYQKMGALQRYMKLLLHSMEGGRYRRPKYEDGALRRLKRTSNMGGERRRSKP